MTEILTESFCERCGTRYTFESAAPRKSRLSRVRVLSKGVRNFVMSDDASLSEAMADARSEEELAATTFQLDAFHKTFNFCLTCRQYTCSDCWNDADGRCLTCAPRPGQDEPMALIDLAPAVEAGPSPSNGRVAIPQFDAEAWPQADLPVELANQAGSEAELAAGAELADQVGSEAEPVAAGSPEPAAAAPQISGLGPGQSLDEAIAAYEAMLEADAVTPAAAAPIEPDVDTLPIAAELAEAAPSGTIVPQDREAAQAEARTAATEALAAQAEALAAQAEALATETAQAQPTPAEAVAAAPQPPVPEPPPPPAEVTPVAAEPIPTAPEPADAEVGSAPEPVRAEPATAPPTPDVPGARPPARDEVAQPTWPTPPAPPAPVAPPSPDQPAPAQPAPVPQTPAQNPPSPWLTVAPDEPAQPAPQWPAAPQWPSSPQWPAAGEPRQAPLTLAGRQLLPQIGETALWAASAQEVLGPAPAQPSMQEPAPTAQPCVNCGLPLSANARFCRRCGSRQGA